MNRLYEILAFTIHYSKTENTKLITTIMKELPTTEFKGINLYAILLIKQAYELDMPPSMENLIRIGEVFLNKYITTYKENTSLNTVSSEDFDLPGKIDSIKNGILEELVQNVEIHEFEPIEKLDIDFKDESKIRILEFYEMKKKEITRDMITALDSSISNGMEVDFGLLGTTDNKIKTYYDEGYLKEVIEVGEIESFSPTLMFKTQMKSLDTLIGGVYTGDLWSLESTSGVGKTRMAVGHICHTAIMSNKNVLYITLEETNSKIESLLVSRHIIYKYDVQIENKIIYRNLYTEDKERWAYIEAAKQDLKTNPDYGKYTIASITLDVNNIEDKIKMYEAANGITYDVIVLDHAYIVSAKRTRDEGVLSHHDIVSKTYKTMKQLVKGKERFALVLNQFNQKGAEKAALGKSPGQDGVAGGLEACRNTDLNIAIVETDAMKQQNQVKLYLTKSRDNEADTAVVLKAYKAYSSFV